MSSETLRATLLKLHEELGAARTLDPAAKAQLEQVSADIHRLLDEPGKTLPAHGPRLEEAAVQFERDHPSLAAVVRQVADALSRVGL